MELWGLAGGRSFQSGVLTLRNKRMELRTCGESDPRERDKGVKWAQPPEPPLPTWGLDPARPTLGSQLPRFSSRREVWEGERLGCACLLLPPLPSAGPFPSRQETSPDSQPAAALPPSPLLQPGPTESPRRPAGPATPPRLHGTGPVGPICPGGGPSPQAPPPGPRASPLPPPRWPSTRLLVRVPTEPLSPGPLASESEKAWDTGHGCERAFVLGRLGGKGQKPGLESWPGGEGAGGRPPHLTLSRPSRVGELTSGTASLLSLLALSVPDLSATPESLPGVTGRARTRWRSRAVGRGRTCQTRGGTTKFWCGK